MTRIKIACSSGETRAVAEQITIYFVFNKSKLYLSFLALEHKSCSITISNLSIANMILSK